MIAVRAATRCALLSATIGLCTAVAGAQTPAAAGSPWGTWFIGTVVLPGGARRIGGYVEAQVRTNALFGQYFYNEVKAGASYDLDPNFTVLVGTGRYTTYQPQALQEGPVSTEQRLWEQLVLNQYFTRLKIEHRYRVEQRWLSQRDGSDLYRNRLRYRLNAFLPLNHRSITENTAFVSVYNEVFLNPSGPVFERNRFYAGVGYQAGAHWVGQLGWLRQANFTPATAQLGTFMPAITATKSNLVFAVTYRLTPRKSAAEPNGLPSQQD